MAATANIHDAVTKKYAGHTPQSVITGHYQQGVQLTKVSNLYIKPFSNKKTAGIYAATILGRDHVKKYIEKRKQEIREKYNIELDYIVLNLRKVIDTVANQIDNPDPTGKKKVSYDSLTKAAEVLAKLGGFINSNNNNLILQGSDEIKLSFGDWTPITPIEEIKRIPPMKNENENVTDID